MAVRQTVTLREWERCPREAGSVLPGTFLPDDEPTRRLVQQLSQKGVLHIQEGRRGIAVSATSFVGRIRFGHVEITVQPKITGVPLLQLLRYAYGLRNVRLLGMSAYDVSSLSFVDLLIHQLGAEANELLRHGLRREYVRQSSYLAVPCGRLEARPKSMSTFLCV